MMMHEICARFLPVMLLVLLLATGALQPLPLSYAQEDDTAVDQELLNRVLAALEKQDSYDSYVETVVQSQDLSLTLLPVFSLTEMTMSSNLASDFERTTTVVMQDGTQNVQSDIWVEVNAKFEDGATPLQTTTYVVQGEARRIGDDLYVKASYGDEVDPEVFNPLDFPQDWVLVDEMEDWQQVFFELRLNYFLEDGNAFESREILSQAATQVSSEMRSLEDGSEVEAITVTLAGDGIDQLVSQSTQVEESDPLFNAFFGSLNEMTYEFLLDENDNLRQVSTEFAIRADMNMGEIDFEYTGQIGIIEANFSQVVTFSEFNEPQEPVEVPLGF